MIEKLWAEHEKCKNSKLSLVYASCARKFSASVTGSMHDALISKIFLLRIFNGLWIGGIYEVVRKNSIHFSNCLLWYHERGEAGESEFIKKHGHFWHFFILAITTVVQCSVCDKWLVINFVLEVTDFKECWASFYRLTKNSDRVLAIKWRLITD